MGTLVWGCAISMVRTTGGAQSPAGSLILSIVLFLTWLLLCGIHIQLFATTCLLPGGQAQTAKLRMSGGIIARPASIAPGSSFYSM